MSHYDVAAGVSSAGLNDTVGKFYQNPIAQQKIFSGTIVKTLDVIGEVTLTYQITAVPVVQLAPPSPAKWDGSQRTPPNLPMPPDNMFQLGLTLKGTAAIGSAAPIAAEGPIEVYGQLAIADNLLSLPPLAIWIDESSFSPWDQLIVNKILIPQALAIATQALSSIPLPTIPTFLGLTFQPPIAAIVYNSEIVVATTLVDGGATDLSGHTAPGISMYVMSGLRPVNAGLSTVVAELPNPIKKDAKTGSDAWYAAARISTQVRSLVAGYGGPSLQVAVDVDNTSGYGELGGEGVGVVKAVLCPIGTAIDAIDNPQNWDKVIAQFGITYTPRPLPIPLSFAVVMGKKNQVIQASIGELDKFTPIFTPQWSGEIIGTILATAAAAFLDLVSVTFGTLITNDILGKYAQDISLYDVPRIATSVEGITLELRVPDGTALTPFGQYLVQPFFLFIS